MLGCCDDRRFVPRQPLQQLDGSFLAGHRGDLIPNPFGVGAVGWVAENRLRRRTNRLRGALLGSNNTSHAKFGAPFGVAWLVCIDRQHHHWQAKAEAGHDRAVATVCQHQVAVGQQRRMRHILFDDDVRRQWAELGVARVVGPQERTPEAIRAATQAVLRDPSYRVNAERVRDEIAAMPGLERAVELLERLARDRAPIIAAR